MQRWIVIGGVVLFLLLGGGAFGFYQYRQNKVDQSYLPIPFNPEATEAQKQDSIKNVREHLLTDKILDVVAKDCGAKDFWKLASDADALAEVKKRAFVESATDTNQAGLKYPSMRIGFRGKRKEFSMLSKLAERWGKDLRFEQKSRTDDF
ncbi:MAG: hypothetical protein JWO82_1385 [Akkermansiaceae bacterium]|nr:hypothetical protein [Akkermansiaceae bacterium]